jgi:hypothetical protein
MAITLVEKAQLTQVHSFLMMKILVIYQNLNNLKEDLKVLNNRSSSSCNQVRLILNFVLSKRLAIPLLMKQWT